MPRLRPFFPITALLLSLAAPSVSQAQAPAQFEQTLPNGLKIICRQETATPLVSLQVFVKTNPAQDALDKPGLGDFVARTLFAGQTDETPEMEASEIGSLGGNVTAAWQTDWTQISVLSLADKYTDAAFLVTNALKNADFDPDTVEQTRQSLLSDIDSASAGVFQIAYAGIRQKLYADTPYDASQQETIPGAARITRADLLRYYNRAYVPQHFTFVVVGNIDPQTAAAKIVGDMEDFPTKGRSARRADPAPDPLPLPTADTPPVHNAQPDFDEVAVMVGYRVPPPSSPDYPAVLVANALLGGMKTSLLFTNLREKQGLSYELGSLVNAQTAAADLTAYVFAPLSLSDPLTKKDVPVRAASVQDQILHQVALLQAGPPAPADLLRAKHYLIGSYKLRHERLEDRASLVGTAALSFPDGARFDTDYADHINSVSAEDVQRIAATFFVHPAVSIVEPDAKNGGVIFE